MIAERAFERLKVLSFLVRKRPIVDGPGEIRSLRGSDARAASDFIKKELPHFAFRGIRNFGQPSARNGRLKWPDLSAPVQRDGPKFPEKSNLRMVLEVPFATKRYRLKKPVLGASGPLWVSEAIRRFRPPVFSREPPLPSFEATPR